MWDYKYFRRLDFRTLPIIGGLMLISLLVISATTLGVEQSAFLTPHTQTQMKWFFLGCGVYLFFAGIDYLKFRSLAWILYFGMIVLLIGLFFTGSIQNVQRWYRIPFLGISFQPSEYAKLIVVIALSTFLEKHPSSLQSSRSIWKAIGIVAVPFFLILKQPDLGTALVLFPIAMVMFYFGSMNKKVVGAMGVMAMAGILFVMMMFLGVFSHEEMRPYVTKVMKEYQYERLNPNTYHQKASQMAIALGGLTGSGWKESEFTGGKWLPAAHTDSVFAAYAEEFGLVGVFFLLLLFFGLIYFSFQVTAVAKDRFGRLLSSGITVYLAMHILINIGMMCGFLPITGVPLILITYGGSSVLSTMSALGILQSIYSRRFTFA